MPKIWTLSPYMKKSIIALQPIYGQIQFIMHRNIGHFVALEEVVTSTLPSHNFDGFLFFHIKKDISLHKRKSSLLSIFMDMLKQIEQKKVQTIQSKVLFCFMFRFDFDWLSLVSFYISFGLFLFGFVNFGKCSRCPVACIILI